MRYVHIYVYIYIRIYIYMCVCVCVCLPSLLYNGYRVFPGGKVQAGRDADPSPPYVPLLSLRAFVAYDRVKPTCVRVCVCVCVS